MFCEHTCKVIIVGDTTVGKTSIIKRLVDNVYNLNEKATLGVDFFIRTFYTTDTNKPIKIHIWDTAGQERFAQLVHSYFRGAHVILFTFDLSNKKSFTSVEERWFKQAKWLVDEETKLYPQNMLVYLIGNKLDNQRRQVDKQEAAQFAEQHGMRAYMELSAATGEHVQEHFQTIVNDAYDLLKGEWQSSNEDEEFDLTLPKTSEVMVARDQTIKKRNCC